MRNALSYVFDDENVLDDKAPKGKCLMDQIFESHTNISNDNIGTLDTNISQAATDTKSDWESTSMYQIPVQCEKILGGDIEGVVS
ncbi:unnamed protein product [Lactuca saligna]|uniref:Uncharacterized protein n=1 Tax=Lactuca saligna TaxID=75948 RepID=A0AA35YI22_LACSI|nr:unnamed protein product [Lactuca saligna]